jgi:hypothetical protein
MKNLLEDNIILITLAIFLIVFLLLCFQFVPKARLLPLTVGVPTLALVLFRLIANLVPGLSEKYQTIREHDIFDLGEIKRKLASTSHAEKQAADSKHKNEMNVIGWLIGLILAIWLVGFLISIPAFVLLFLKFRSGEKWVSTLCVTFGTWLFIYGVFVVALKLPLYSGILLGE